MRSSKSFFGVAGALLPVLYCAGLAYYFLDLSGSVQEAQATGLGPTVLGLGAVGLLFSIPLIMKVVRIVTRPRSPGSGGDGPDDGKGFDADAAIARYKARQSQETVSNPAPVAPAPKNRGPERPTFGRRSSG